MVMKFHIIAVLGLLGLLSLLLADGFNDPVVTNCSRDDNHFTLRATHDDNGAFVNAIGLDTSAGVVFRGYGLIDSATDIRKDIAIVYDSDSKQLTVKTPRNNRLLEGVEKQCVVELGEFLSSAEIAVPIVYL